MGDVERDKPSSDEEIAEIVEIAEIGREREVDVG